MNSHDLRNSFLDYFQSFNHEVVPSASLIPHDPSVMFTIAGMIPFKTYFTRDEVPPFNRATSAQKCFRTVDIDIIGTTTRHLSFFEMLGNFSFGDYFKDDAIAFAWNFLTKTLELPKDKLWITVHESDNDSIELWKKIADVESDRIQVMGDDNFWKMGDIGPCGPCSEIYFDKGKLFGKDGGPKFGGSDRFIEIWNLVFMQFSRDKNGVLNPLPYPSIDTGAGLERILPIINSLNSVFDTDLFYPIIEFTQSLTEVKYNNDGAGMDKNFRVIADHSRAATMLIADGVFPSNEGRGYTLRRIIRRLIKNLWQLGIEAEIGDRYVDLVVSSLGDTYTNLKTGSDYIKTVLQNEELNFKRTLQQGLFHIDSLVKQSNGFQKSNIIDGDTAFKLYDTFGFPLELTVEIASESGFKVDTTGFEKLMEIQRQRAQQDAKNSARFKNDTEEDIYKELFDSRGKTEFIGYEQLEADSTILKVIAIDNDDSSGPNKQKSESDDMLITHAIILEQTPFYAQSGGQVGDQGYLISKNTVFKVLDTQNTLNSIIKHMGYFVEGIFIENDSVHAEVDAKRRISIMRNHTATHLLHHYLREVLGDHVRQQGSLVAPDRLRFDFSHFGPLDRKELEVIQHLCNLEIISNSSVSTQVVDKSDAEKMGAIAFFGDKYGQTVRVVSAGANSMEFCGGTHVDSLGIIGSLQIISESSIGSNTRRIEAITGEYALNYLEVQNSIMSDAVALIKSTRSDFLVDLQKVLDKSHQLEKQIKQMKSESVVDLAESLMSSMDKGIIVAQVNDLELDHLKTMAFKLKDYESLRAAFLVSLVDNLKMYMVLISNDKSINAGNIVKELAKIVNGGGGGSPNIANAAGKDVTKINELLKSAREMLTG